MFCRQSENHALLPGGTCYSDMPEKADVTRRHAIDGVLYLMKGIKIPIFLRLLEVAALLLPPVLLPPSLSLARAPATTASSAGTPENHGRLCSLRKPQQLYTPHMSWVLLRQPSKWYSYTFTYSQENRCCPRLWRALSTIRRRGSNQTRLIPTV